MSFRLRRGALAAACASVLSLMSVPESSLADTDLIPGITLGTSLGALNGGQTWTTTGALGGNVDFRWVSAPGKSTFIIANRCADGAQLGSGNTFAAGDDTYARIWNGYTYSCFYLRGRVQAPQSPMANPHDGRVRF